MLGNADDAVRKIDKFNWTDLGSFDYIFKGVFGVRKKYVITLMVLLMTIATSTLVLATNWQSPVSPLEMMECECCVQGEHSLTEVELEELMAGLDTRDVDTIKKELLARANELRSMWNEYAVTLEIAYNAEKVVYDMANMYEGIMPTSWGTCPSCRSALSAL